MNAWIRSSAVLAAYAIAISSASAQLNLPRIVVLPDEDFVWPFGDNPSVDDRSRPDFKIVGVERQFSCELTGAFRAGSRMSDFENQRQFEQYLGTTIEFIQAATQLLNDLYLSNDLDWAILDCRIPEANESEDALQERLDKAVERALRQRERRREREARSDN